MAARKPKAYVPPIPPELAGWIAERIGQLELLLEDIRSYQGDDEATWTMFVLERLARIEETSIETARLMTKYAVDKRMARPATIAKLIGVHQSSVMSRSSSEAARTAWEQIWPSEDG